MARDNDPDILSEDDLWRRIHPLQIIMDNNEGRVRPSSQAFRDQELSVFLARDDTPERALQGFADKGFALAAITAGLARDNAQTVWRDPTLIDPSHVVVEGKKKRTVDCVLALAARWVGESPPPPDRTKRG